MDSTGDWDNSIITSVVVTADKLTNIKAGAFWDCTNLETVTLLNVTKIENNAFNTCAKLKSIDLSNVTDIGLEAFKDCIALGSVDLSKATTIGGGAFMGCKSLMLMPNGNFGNLTTIEQDTFNGCAALGSVDLSNVSIIKGRAFSGCTNLTLDGNLDNVSVIHENPFAGCIKITTFPMTAGGNAYYKTVNGVLYTRNGDKLVAYPAGKTDDKYTVVIENWDIDINASAFSGCTSLKSIEGIENANSIGNNTFSGCISLTDIDLSTIKEIEDSAFEGCTSLKTVIIPICTDIQYSAFKDCTKLETVVIPNGCKIKSDAFEGVPQTTFKLYVLTENAEDDISAYKELNPIEATYDSIKEIYIATDGMIFDESDNSLTFGGDCGASNTGMLLWALDDEGTLKIKGDGTEMKNYTTVDLAPWYIHKDKISRVVIKAKKLNKIGDYAFNGCTSLNTVIMLRVSEIGGNAFNGCTSLNTVIMPKVSKIGGNAFNDCKSLNTVVIPNSCAIETGAFNGVSSTSKLYVLTDTNEEQINVTGAESLNLIKATKDSEQKYICIATDGMIFYIYANSFAFIDITPKPANVEKGKTLQFTAKVISTRSLAQTVTWASSDNTVATVDETTGVVTAVKVGTAIITATSTDDTTKLGTATVTVTEPSTGGGYFPPTPDPTAPIQPKEHTITNADGTKTTVILFDGTKSGTLTKGEALLSAEALAKIAAVKGAGAVVATSTSIVQFDQKALQAITGGQTKGNIKVIAEIVSPDTLTPEEKALLGDNALIIDLSVENENGKVTDFNGGTATVVINIPAGVDPNTLGAVYIKTNGKLEKVEGKVVMVNGVATFQFVTNHFSKFAVLDKATIDKAIAAQDAMAKDKLVKGVKATRLTAIKAVAKKSNVTVTWKKSKGYKVDGYQIWKSSKKTTDYKMMAKRTGQKYKNTYGLKAGKTYYYKVRGFREIDGKIVYTKWAKAKVVAK